MAHLKRFAIFKVILADYHSTSVQLHHFLVLTEAPLSPLTTHNTSLHGLPSHPTGGKSPSTLRPRWSEIAFRRNYKKLWSNATMCVWKFKTKIRIIGPDQIRAAFGINFSDIITPLIPQFWTKRIHVFVWENVLSENAAEERLLNSLSVRLVEVGTARYSYPPCLVMLQLRDTCVTFFLFHSPFPPLPTPLPLSCLCSTHSTNISPFYFHISTPSIFQHLLAQVIAVELAILYCTILLPPKLIAHLYKMNADSFEWCTRGLWMIVFALTLL